MESSRVASQQPPEERHSASGRREEKSSRRDGVIYRSAAMKNDAVQAGRLHAAVLHPAPCRRGIEEEKEERKRMMNRGGECLVRPTDREKKDVRNARSIRMPF